MKINKLTICAIIVLYYPNHKELIKNIESIYDQVNKVCLVDNSADKDTQLFLEKIKKKFSKLKIIKNPSNYGIAKALNIGVKYAIEKNYEWVLTLDQDSFIFPKTISKVLYNFPELFSNPKIAIILLNSNNPKNLQDYENITFEISSANFVRSLVYKNVGFYNETYFIDCVDTEFCFRIISHQYKIIKLNKIRFDHSLGQQKKIVFLGKVFYYNQHSPIREYYIARNNIKLLKKYYYKFPLELFVIWNNLIKNLIKLILFGDQKILKLKNILKGFLEGISG